MTDMGFAVQLKQASLETWDWAVLDEDGHQAATGKCANEAIAREEAEFFRRSLTRFRRVTKRW